MADVALTAAEVGRVVQYVAPGFFARAAYEARFPQGERSAVTLLVWSVAASFPLVALGNAFADLVGVARDPTDPAYVALLLGVAAVVGYLASLLRSWGKARDLLIKAGFAHQPDGSLYAATMLGLRRSSVVTLELEDGRKLSGTPRAGPSYAEDAVDELVLTNPAWLVGGNWSEQGAGEAVLVPLRHVKTITFEDDPFGTSVGSGEQVQVPTTEVRARPRDAL